MERTKEIRTAFARNAKALRLRPALGRGTAVTKVSVRDGLTCEIVDGPWRLVADLGETSGGRNAGPNPGVLGRGALGACLAMSYSLWAAQRGVALDGIEVEIQADYDAGSHYGVVDEPPGYSEVRYVVTLQSDAPAEELVRLLDEADAHTPFHDVFSRAQPLRREVRIVAHGRSP